MGYKKINWKYIFILIGLTTISLGIIGIFTDEFLVIYGMLCGFFSTLLFISFILGYDIFIKWLNK